MKIFYTERQSDGRWRAFDEKFPETQRHYYGWTEAEAIGNLIIGEGTVTEVAGLNARIFRGWSMRRNG